jgi:hypothetical protein
MKFEKKIIPSENKKCVQKTNVVEVEDEDMEDDEMVFKKRTDSKLKN